MKFVEPIRDRKIERFHELASGKSSSGSVANMDSTAALRAGSFKTAPQTRLGLISA